MLCASPICRVSVISGMSPLFCSRSKTNEQHVCVCPTKTWRKIARSRGTARSARAVAPAVISKICTGAELRSFADKPMCFWLGYTARGRMLLSELGPWVGQDGSDIPGRRTTTSAWWPAEHQQRVEESLANVAWREQDRMCARGRALQGRSPGGRRPTQRAGCDVSHVSSWTRRTPGAV